MNILVGINGSGKTTILELIKHALQNEYQEKARYAPQEFKITFDNNESIHYQRYQRKNQVEGPGSRLNPEFISTFDMAIGGRDENSKEKLSGVYKRQLTEMLEERIGRVTNDLPPAGIDATPHINEFVKIVNEVFERTEKSIKCTFDQAPRSFGVVFRLADGERLMTDQLSAGEKQILIILLTALISKLKSLTKEEKHCVFIMDEPEISLHVEWQEELVRRLFQLNDQIQIIIATHSPGVMMGGRYKVVKMEKILNRST